MRRVRVILGTVAAAAALSLVPAALAGTPADDLAWLNAKRAANGIPGDIALRADWSEACANHVRYMRATGSIAHEEDPASPSWTASGDWAGRNAVLASADPWTAADFIWERAPLHLAQLMAPPLAAMGIADDGQLVCATTVPGYTRTLPAIAQTASYPGNGTRIYAAEIAEEWPTTPAQDLGLSQPTGPNLLVYRWGGADDDPGVLRARLDGPSGPVRVRWIDRDDPRLGPYLPPGSAIVVPITPLAQNAAYTGLVEFDDGTAHAWAFSTSQAPAVSAIRRERLTARRTGSLRVCVEPSPAGCRRWAERDRVVVELRGRIVGAGGGPPIAGTAVDVRRSDGPIRRTVTAADGTFRVRLRAVVRRGQRVIGVTASVPGDAVGAWPARIRRTA
ncbi:MAG: hypothetical protein RL190_936 [Actinomycetota bacterium]|jgi:hypothetical protein